MDKAKIKLGLKDLDVPGKLRLADKVIESMNDNPDFPDADTMLVQLIAKRDEMKAQLTKRDGPTAATQSATELLNTREDAFDNAITFLARDVEKLADFVAAIEESAGFETFVPGKSGPVGPLPEVRDLFLQVGIDAGSFDSSWKSIKEASNYEVEITPAPIFEPNWVQVGMPTAAQLTITGLESGTKYWVRVRANGPGGSGPWSDPAARYAP